MFTNKYEALSSLSASPVSVDKLSHSHRQNRSKRIHLPSKKNQAAENFSDLFDEAMADQMPASLKSQSLIPSLQTTIDKDLSCLINRVQELSQVEEDNKNKAEFELTKQTHLNALKNVDEEEKAPEKLKTVETAEIAKNISFKCLITQKNESEDKRYEDKVQNKQLLFLEGEAKCYYNTAFCKKTSPAPFEGAAFEHMSKRLELLSFTFNYVDKIKAVLAEFQFARREFSPPHEFKADLYNRPLSMKKEKDFENAHISLFNKIVVQYLGKDQAIILGNHTQKMEYKKFYIIKDEVVFKNAITNLQVLLNLCDYSPIGINQIDGIMELLLRPYTKDLMDFTRSGKMHPKDATNKLIVEYRKELNYLKESLEKGDSNLHLHLHTTRTAQNSIDVFFKSLKSSTQLSNSLLFVNEMLKAIDNFAH